MAKLIFGCGYLGSRVAQRWRALGDDVYVVTRSASRARELADHGYAPIVADVTQPGTLADLPAADTVLYAVGFDRAAGHSVQQVYVEGLRAALDALARAGSEVNEEPLTPGPSPARGEGSRTETTAFKKLIYISSTGVYGQAGGEIVDEDSPCGPTRESGRAVLAAEQILAAHALGRRAIVLRMAGLYGPGRIPNAADIARGRPIPAVPEGWLNLIHVDDATSVVMAAEARVRPPRTYVISDGHAIERREYYAELARALGAPAPTFVPPPGDDPAALRASASKRVSNRRMATELNVVLRYPSYRDGLAQIVAAELRGESPGESLP